MREREPERLRGVAAGVDFGRAKLAWLRTYLPFAAGVPSHDTLNRVMGLLEPRAFEQCLIAWARRGVTLPDGAQVCLDGKRLCRSATARQQQTPHALGGASAVHLLHAWCDEVGLCLGQYQTPDKANEITALPDLLALLEVGGCLLTMDAIGCQKSVTQAIAAAGADYLLALKGNQVALQAAVQAAFAQAPEAQAPEAQAPTPVKKPPTGAGKRARAARTARRRTPRRRARPRVGRAVHRSRGRGHAYGRGHGRDNDRNAPLRQQPARQRR